MAVTLHRSPSRRPRPRPAAAWVVLIAAAAIGAACGRSSDPEIGPTARAETGRIERIVVASGTIEPENEVEVRSRISGIVDRVFIKEGDQVGVGQPLVEIERELLEAQVAEARAQLDGARVELTRAQQELRRAVTLRGGEMIAEREAEEAKARTDAATAAVARGQALLDGLQIQLGYTTVVAPIAGRILDVDAKKGSAVASVASVTGGTRLLIVAEDQSLHVKGLVDENEIGWVQVGQRARIRTEAYPGRTFDGTVRKIKAHGERQQNVTYFEVEVLVTDAQGALRSRMSADADIIAEVVDEATIVPETALLYDGGRIYVEKVVSASPRHIEPQTVAVGIIENGRVQVLEGLGVGDEVRVK